MKKSPSISKTIFWSLAALFLLSLIWFDPIARFSSMVLYGDVGQSCFDSPGMVGCDDNRTNSYAMAVGILVVIGFGVTVSGYLWAYKWTRKKTHR